MYLCGDAIVWHECYMQDKATFLDWRDYISDMSLRFGEGELQDPIVLWKNLNQIGSVSDYQKEFERIRARVKCSKRQFVAMFVGGLKEEIQHAVRAPLPSLKSLPPLLPLPPDSQRLPLPNSFEFPPINPKEKKQKGLCFWCDERHGPGHRCSKKKLYNLEIISIDEDAGSVETNDENFDLNQMLITEPHISTHALTGEVGYNTIKMIGQVGKRQILILIDSGSTHNFLNAKLAKELRCEIKGAKSYQVILADGSKITGVEKCDKFKREVQGHVFTIEVMLLPLREYDLILGIQWLEPLGQVLWDFKLRTLHFKYKSHLVHIEVAPKPTIKWVENDKLLSLLLKKEQDDKSDYFLVQVISEVDSRCSLNATEVVEKPVNLRKLLEEFSEVFDEAKSLPDSRSLDHQIHLKTGTEPISIRPYKYPSIQKDAMEQIVSEMLQSGVIRNSTSSFSSPVVMVKKRGGTWRMCIDYKELNKAIVKNKFPMPVIEELLDELHGAKYFSKIDLRSGYHQIEMKEANIHKTAFRTHQGRYEFLVIPFGLTNAHSTFQATMNFAFQQYLRKFVLRIEYLGHIISSQGVATNPNKIVAMKEWPMPKNVKKLRGFLGLTGYYRRFVRNYGLISRPLTNLLKKNSFTWGQAAQEAFEELKKAMTSTPVLALPNFQEEFVIEIDASSNGVGAVLM
ncbi:hypothetical protein SLEP1_g13320 [Rubroshorea leprosula]|uniref:Uncharacterized protein n=1 Tax=Rubroshorea leprosula TaxID=152421 RepID=A0AAV5IPI5_9ROSI|nr:hypothetical protein SLEP1_g13320 [Rubroshorea leprosula]